MQTKTIICAIIATASLCGCNPTPREELSIVPRPCQVTRARGYFSVDSASFASDPAMYADFANDCGIPPEGYVLDVSRKGIKVTSSDSLGAFYALQTLRQMVCSEGVPCSKITDSPRFHYSGIHLDVSRHFFPKEEVFKILDEMAFYKLNYFHLHLTDNGGWRIKLDRYPELTAKGSYRTQKNWVEWWDKQDKRYLDEGTPGAYGGYYTKDDIRAILEHARRNNIEVIPEIEFPAHSDAVFISHPELCCEGRAYSSGEFCAGNPLTYKFIENVLDEIIELFPS